MPVKVVAAGGANPRKSAGIFLLKKIGMNLPFVCWQVVLEVAIFLMEMMFRSRKRSISNYSEPMIKHLFE